MYFSIHVIAKTNTNMGQGGLQVNHLKTTCFCFFPKTKIEGFHSYQPWKGRTKEIKYHQEEMKAAPKRVFPKIGEFFPQNGWFLSWFQTLWTNGWFGRVFTPLFLETPKNLHVLSEIQGTQDDSTAASTRDSLTTMQEASEGTGIEARLFPLRLHMKS